MDIALRTALMSKSERLKVGAVLVLDKRILSVGFNGLPSGMEPDILEENNVTKPEVIHAELNCILNCAKQGISILGATLYITHSPCQSCASLIVQSGIKQIIYKDDYRTCTKSFLESMGVIIRQLIDY